MVILADELLESFFEADLANSFRLDRTDAENYHATHQKPDTLVGGLMNLVMTNEYVISVEMMATDSVGTNRASTGLPMVSDQLLASMRSGASHRSARSIQTSLPTSRHESHF
jgi:hypothetical protein